jgi:REP element-mobilizing transposase RayT
MTLFNTRYRVESARLQSWDYALPGYYFITICTKNQECFFGTIMDGKMELSELGKIANKYWIEIPNYFENIELDEFIIMPNHIHGIIIIRDTDAINRASTTDTASRTDAPPSRTDAINRASTTDTASRTDAPSSRTDAINRASTTDTASRTDAINRVSTIDNRICTGGGISGIFNPMMHKNISRIIRWYKGRISFEIRKSHPEFAWQSRFHDHIIRTETELDRIRYYIQRNPQKWGLDEYRAFP